MGGSVVLLLLCDVHEKGTEIIVMSTVHEDGMNAHHVALLFLQNFNLHSITVAPGIPIDFAGLTRE